MTAHVLHATFDAESRRELQASADELLGALWTGYTHASDFFRANPTPKTWRTLVRAHALYRVAFLAEDNRDEP